VNRTKGGTVLSATIERALADEAEAGYDLRAAKRRRVGRPSLARGVSPRVDVRVEPDLAKALHKRARKEHRSVSEVTREALRRYLAS
jgi:hypothetical protein